MHFMYQESKIWEAGNPVDVNGKWVRIKAKTEERARKQLPDPDSGRTWVLIKSSESPIQDPGRFRIRREFPAPPVQEQETDYQFLEDAVDACKLPTDRVYQWHPLMGWSPVRWDYE